MVDDVRFQIHYAEKTVASLERVILIGSKERELCSRISFLHSNLTSTLEFFHNTDYRYAPRQILPPTAANIDKAYSNAYPTKCLKSPI